MNDFAIFKIEYDWCDGDHNEVLLGKEVSAEEFEKDLIEARSFAEGLMGKKVEKIEDDYIGKGYRLECLPEFYEQIIWYLTNKLGYVYCDYDEKVTYGIDDGPEKKILLMKSKNKVETIEIKDPKEEFEKLTKFGQEFARKKGIKDEEDVMKIIHKGRINLK